MQPVVLRWQVSSFHGWGVYGLNLALSWAAGGSDIEPACAMPIQPEMLILDPIHRLALQPFVTRSERLQAQLHASANRHAKLNVPILFGLGAEFEIKPAAHNVMLDGGPSIGVVFFEGPLSAEAVERTKRFDAIIAGSGIVPPVSLTPSGEINVTAWSGAAGIPAGKVIDLGFVPNMLMPSILSAIDVAAFPNRAEGGTNLVAMECMACGIPVILSRNTGHLDLIEDGNCYVLEDQRQSQGGWPGNDDVAGWGESSVDELFARMEEVFSNPDEGARRGARAAQFMSRLTWAKTAQNTRDVIMDLRRSNTT